ncbi:MAG: hypothetical protein E7623_07450, partial [Ruminococcaceae bacterium]|nr:hypothetical protein [Oscillospiraceae bacterium]
MTQTVYADVMFLIDFSIDFLSLYICGCFMSLKMKLMRLSLGAVLGALFSIAVLFASPGGVLKLILSAAACALICLCAFGKRALLYRCLLFCGVNFALAGGITALFSFINSLRREYDVIIYGNSETIFTAVPPPKLLLGAAICGILTLCLGCFVKRNVSKRTVNVYLRFGNKERNFKGLVDSGNFLCEPISGTPCIIAKTESLEGLMPEDLYEYINKNCVGEPPPSAYKLRIIPMSTVGTNGMVYALCPDGIKLDGEQKKAYL